MHLTQLSPAGVAEVLDLAASAELVDGHPPLSDQTRLHLSSSGPHASSAGVHLLSRSDGALVGYANLHDGEAELVVEPEHRRQGIGTTLLDELLAHSPELAVWAHGSVPGSEPLARSHGLQPARTLLRMARPPGGAALPAPVWADGISVRTYTSADGPDLLRVNARAFSHHPEQGRWTAGDLALRAAQPWFDPGGIFLAFRGDDLVGFHWTKTVDGVGEVYVVGVDPGAQGLGLGRALTLVGLHHLAARLVRLYVDEENVPAARLYRSLGFDVEAADVRWTTPIVPERSRHEG